MKNKIKIRILVLATAVAGFTFAPAKESVARVLNDVDCYSAQIPGLETGYFRCGICEWIDDKFPGGPPLTCTPEPDKD